MATAEPGPGIGVPSGLVVYGDFNCPYSALASSRVERLAASGVDVEWRAVQHDAGIPTVGREVADVLAGELRDELAQIRGLLRPGEATASEPPPVLPNTFLASRRYAGAPTVARAPLRAALFDALWQQRRDIGDANTVADIAGGDDDGDTAAVWQGEWEARPRPIVPVMVLPDGTVSRGLGALARLASYLDVVAPAAGGETL